MTDILFNRGSSLPGPPFKRGQRPLDGRLLERPEKPPLSASNHQSAWPPRAYNATVLQENTILHTQVSPSTQHDPTARQPLTPVNAPSIGQTKSLPKALLPLLPLLLLLRQAPVPGERRQLLQALRRDAGRQLAQGAAKVLHIDGAGGIRGRRRALLPLGCRRRACRRRPATPRRLARSSSCGRRPVGPPASRARSGRRRRSSSGSSSSFLGGCLGRTSAELQQVFKVEALGLTVLRVGGCVGGRCGCVTAGGWRLGPIGPTHARMLNATSISAPGEPVDVRCRERGINLDHLRTTDRRWKACQVEGPTTQPGAGHCVAVRTLTPSPKGRPPPVR
jgi:hypothetical protein